MLSVETERAGETECAGGWTEASVRARRDGWERGWSPRYQSDTQESSPGHCDHHQLQLQLQLPPAQHNAASSQYN